MTRMCAECPEWTQTVCRYAFGKLWNDKSSNGEGCEHSLDDVAAAWKAAGWTPEDGGMAEIAIPLPVMPTRPVRPVRPKVSANILRQAERFFGRKS